MATIAIILWSTVVFTMLAGSCVRVLAGLFQIPQSIPKNSPFQPRVNPGIHGSGTQVNFPASHSGGVVIGSPRLGPGVGLGTSPRLNSRVSPGIGMNPISSGTTNNNNQLDQFGPNQVGSRNRPLYQQQVPFSSQATPFTPQLQVPYQQSYGAPALCGGHVWLQDSAPRAIVSPNYPSQYPNDTYCEWRIFASFGQQLRINSTDFALENSETCKSDYVQFFWSNGSPSMWTMNKMEIDRFCGTDGPVDLVFKDNSLVMTLVTDRTRTHRGFNISFTIFQTCAILFEQPDFQGYSTVLEEFYESRVYPSYSDNVFTSVEVTHGCKLMVCSDENFEGTCHLFFKTNRNISPLHINWPRSASCICS